MAEENTTDTPNNDTVGTPAPSPFANPSTEKTDAETPGTTDGEEKTLIGPKDKKDSPEAGDGQNKEEVPESYDIKLEEGLELDEGTLELFTPIFKELGITNEGAQKLVDAYVPLIQSTIDEQRKQGEADYKEITEGWKTKTVTELGSTFKENMSAVGRSLNKFGNDELRTLMSETGIGNHVEMVRFMAKVGKTISEDTITDGDAPQNKPGANQMYPSMPQ